MTTFNLPQSGSQTITLRGRDLLDIESHAAKYLRPDIIIEINISATGLIVIEERLPQGYKVLKSYFHAKSLT